VLHDVGIRCGEICLHMFVVFKDSMLLRQTSLTFETSSVVCAPYLIKILSQTGRLVHPCRIVAIPKSDVRSSSKAVSDKFQITGSTMDGVEYR
jgi:hypothetical protein